MQYFGGRVELDDQVLLVAVVLLVFRADDESFTGVVLEEGQVLGVLCPLDEELMAEECFFVEVGQEEVNAVVVGEAEDAAVGVAVDEIVADIGEAVEQIEDVAEADGPDVQVLNLKIVEGGEMSVDGRMFKRRLLANVLKELKQ